MARTATIEHTTTGITITVENAPGHYTFDHAADGTPQTTLGGRMKAAKG